MMWKQGERPQLKAAPERSVKKLIEYRAFNYPSSSRLPASLRMRVMLKLP